MKAFVQELLILKKTVHQHLVRMLGASCSENLMQIVMELCHGGACFDLIHNSNFVLSWFQAIKIALDVADAMRYLHAFDPQIIHRDLKSPNILLVEPVENRADVPWVKVADFGLGRMKEAEAAWGTMTMAVGTTHWMAPEVLTGSKYDEKVDLYSFAMILYELISHEIPFEDVEPSAVARHAIRGDRPCLQAVTSDCPEKFVALMTVCWDQDPGRRPSFGNVLRWLNLVAAEVGFNPRQPARVVQL